jgi:hypothetical protein
MVARAMVAFQNRELKVSTLGVFLSQASLCLGFWGGEDVGGLKGNCGRFIDVNIFQRLGVDVPTLISRMVF